MIKREDVKVGLKFVLPVSEIKRYSDGTRYLVQTGAYGLSPLSFLPLEKPGEVFCIESIERGYVCCKVADLENIVVCTETLTQTGFVYDEIDIGGLIKDFKEEISKWFPADRKLGSYACDSPKGYRKDAEDNGYNLYADYINTKRAESSKKVKEAGAATGIPQKSGVLFTGRDKKMLEKWSMDIVFKIMKDWIGNRRAIYTTLGASNHTGKEREGNDYYATDPVAIDRLVGNSFLELPHKIWECACGQGHLSEELKFFGYDVVSTDLVDRGYGDVCDFLKTDVMPDGCECILTNPPYKYALESTKHSLELLPDGGYSVMFLKTTFLEGKKRYKELFSCSPPIYVLQFSERVLCAKNGDFKRMRDGGGSAVAYAWYVWKKGFYDTTEVKWI